MADPGQADRIIEQECALVRAIVEAAPSSWVTGEMLIAGSGATTDWWVFAAKVHHRMPGARCFCHGKF